MRARADFHQGSGDYRGSVNRRVARHEQDDLRGQYPRPRDNQFAQPRTRVPAQPQPAPPPPPQKREETPAQDDVFTANGAQYVKPARPHVPDYMKTAYQQTPREPREFDIPEQPAGDYRRQNPYVVMSEKNSDPKPAMKKRTLIILAAAAVVILAGLWVGRLIVSAQTKAVFAARAAAEEAIERKHPFGYRDLIEREAIENNLHPAFVAAIILNESSFNPSAESYRGARGLMQMMEDTAVWVYDQIGAGADYSFDLMYDAETNVKYGCWYLGYLSEKFGGDPVLVAAAFHSGQTNVLNWLSDKTVSADQRTIALDRMPDGNTKAYVEKVMNAFAAYRRLYYEEVNA